MRDLVTMPLGGVSDLRYVDLDHVIYAVTHIGQAGRDYACQPAASRYGKVWQSSDMD
jgi:hypothetical protein